MDFIKKPGFVVVAVGLVALLIAGVSLYGFYNNTRNEGIAKENVIVANYKDNMNELSSYVLTIEETLGIADRNSDELRKILTEAVQGRYDGNMDPGTGGSMFSAITEAYPDLTSNSALYTKVQDAVMDGRAKYKNKQTILIDRVNEYKTWLDSGLIRNSVVKSLGFPSDRLEVTLGDGTKIYGKAALEKIGTPILDSKTVQSYDSGVQDSLIKPRD